MLKRIQNERKMGFAGYLLVPRHLLLLVVFFLVSRYFVGMITEDGFFRFSLSFFVTGVFFFFFLYPRYPVEYYRKETTLLALTDGRYRREALSRVLRKLPFIR